MHGFHAEKIEVSDELQKYSYSELCTEVGIPAEMLSQDGRKSFRILLNWVSAR